MGLYGWAVVVEKRRRKGKSSKGNVNMVVDRFTFLCDVMGHCLVIAQVDLMTVMRNSLSLILL